MGFEGYGTCIYSFQGWPRHPGTKLQRAKSKHSLENHTVITPRRKLFPEDQDKPSEPKKSEAKKTREGYTRVDLTKFKKKSTESQDEGSPKLVRQRSKGAEERRVPIKQEPEKSPPKPEGKEDGDDDDAEWKAEVWRLKHGDIATSNDEVEVEETPQPMKKRKTKSFHEEEPTEPEKRGRDKTTKSKAADTQKTKTKEKKHKNTEPEEPEEDNAETAAVKKGRTAKNGRKKIADEVEAEDVPTSEEEVGKYSASSDGPKETTPPSNEKKPTKCPAKGEAMLAIKDQECRRQKIDKKKEEEEEKDKAQPKRKKKPEVEAENDTETSSQKKQKNQGEDVKDASKQKKKTKKDQEYEEEYEDATEISKQKKNPVEEEEAWEETWEEPEKPKKKKKPQVEVKETAKQKKTKTQDQGDDDETTKPKKKKKTNQEQEDDDDDDETPEPKKNSAKTAKAKKNTPHEDDEERPDDVVEKKKGKNVEKKGKAEKAKNTEPQDEAGASARSVPEIVRAQTAELEPSTPAESEQDKDKEKKDKLKVYKARKGRFYRSLASLDPSAGGEMWGMYFASECWIVLIIFIFNILFLCNYVYYNICMLVYESSYIRARVIMEGKGEPNNIASDPERNGSKHHHPVFDVSYDSYILDIESNPFQFGV